MNRNNYNYSGYNYNSKDKRFQHSVNYNKNELKSAITLSEADKLYQSTLVEVWRKDIKIWLSDSNNDNRLSAVIGGCPPPSISLGSINELFANDFIFENKNNVIYMKNIQPQPPHKYSYHQLNDLKSSYWAEVVYGNWNRKSLLEYFYLVEVLNNNISSKQQKENAMQKAFFLSQSIPKPDAY